MSGRVLSVNVSLARSVRWDDAEVRTGIFKTPSPGPVPVGATGLEADEQADLRFHGGPHKAVYAYPDRHRRHWAAVLGLPLEPGHFGENLTVEGLDEATVRIGDVFRVGTALLQVSEPRIPCFKLAKRMQAGPTFSTRFLASGRTGFYLRVLEPGRLQAGDVIELLDGTPEAPTVLEFLAATHWAGRTPARLRRAASAPGLSEAWLTRLYGMLSHSLTAAMGNPEGGVPLQVDEIVSETDVIRSVWLKPVDGPLPRHLPGQFLPVTLSDADGRPVRRSYSISSPPGADRLRLTVRLERDDEGRPGLGSGLIHALRPGDRILAQAPAGTLHPDPGCRAPLWLYGAGIGLTPLVSIALDAARQGRPVTMALSARRRADLPLATDLEALANSDHVTVRIVETGLPGATRLSADMIPDPDPDAQVFLCGPAGFVADLRAQLETRGVRLSRILSETFASPPVADQTAPAATVIFAERDTAVETRGETLMEAAEAVGLAPPSGCRAGSCGVCVTRVLSGRVTYLEPVAPPPPDHVHLCVATADGPVKLGPMGKAAGAAMPEWKEETLATFFD